MLKKSGIITLLLLIVQLGFSQFSDDFSDGDFTNSPVWSGDVGTFTAVTNELNSQSAVAANYYLSTPSILAANAQWDFYFNMKFSTSGVNFVDVYLMSDVADVANPNDGYFVRIGGSTDEVSLYKIVGGTPTILIDGPNSSVNSGSNNPFDVRVTRDASNNWTLFYDDGAASSLVSIGTIFDNSINASSFFGIAITQSSAAGPINSHFFDNISVGVIVGDTASPLIDSLVVLNSTNIDAYFNEPVGLSTAETVTNYSVDLGIGNPNTAVRDAVDSTIVHLIFGTPFTNGQNYNLTINNVDDTLTNATAVIVEPFTYLVVIAPNIGDVIINEIFADPSPQITLPTEEFVELYNASTNTLVLNNWQFVNTTTVKTLPNFMLQPNSYVILCDINDTALYSPFGDVIGISSFSALTNGGDSLTLMDDNSNILDIVAYDISWYQDGVKDDGGYTLERINPVHPCSNSLNWIASNDASGGTPGTQNSAFNNAPDIQSPTILSVNIVSSTQINVIFNETMDSASIASAAYSLTGGVSISLVAVHNNLHGVDLTITPALDSSTVYTLTVTEASDCIGNTIGSDNTAIFALPEQAFSEDLIINEVLFNPFTGGSDFVEIYNNSNKFIDLQNWSLANLENDSVDNYKTLITNPKLILPGEFVLLTTNISHVENDYMNAVTSTFLQMESLPTYSNDEGDVYLINNLNMVVDSFRYTDDMHFALLNSEDGVSLERIDYDRPTNDETNWHSAAEDVGFATPGFENSQYQMTNNDGGEVVVEPQTFSPDNDGIDDVLNISYNFPNPGFVATIIIYDAKGRLVKNLVQNELLGISGTFSWDGINDRNEKARIGIYIIFIEAFDADGNVKSFKKTAVLAGHFN